MKDMGSELNGLVDVPSTAIRNGNGATNGGTGGGDLQGYNGAVVQFISGALTDGSVACKLQEDDAAGFGTAADVGAADVVGGVNLVTLALTDDNVVKELAYIGKKRYVRGVMTQSAATTGGFYHSTLLRGFPIKNPA